MSQQPRASAFVADGKPTTLSWVLIAGASAVVLGVLGVLIFVFTVNVPLPDAAPGGQATEVLDTRGDLIGTLKGEQKRKIVPLDQIAPVLRD
ncbi:MAG TPA: hypothetical protein VHJ78_00905, partial [Actinomycetota bacterium]|nr:hypothetical protein [Actinomycetota bacterium]